MNWLGKTLKSNVKPVRCFIPPVPGFSLSLWLRDTWAPGSPWFGPTSRRWWELYCRKPQNGWESCPVLSCKHADFSHFPPKTSGQPPKPATIAVVFCFFRNFIISYVDDVLDQGLKIVHCKSGKCDSLLPGSLWPTMRCMGRSSFELKGVERNWSALCRSLALGLCWGPPKAAQMFPFPIHSSFQKKRRKSKDTSSKWPPFPRRNPILTYTYRTTALGEAWWVPWVFTQRGIPSSGQDKCWAAFLHIPLEWPLSNCSWSGGGGVAHGLRHDWMQNTYGGW